jgi:hypothetical protein
MREKAEVGCFMSADVRLGERSRRSKIRESPRERLRGRDGIVSWGEGEEERCWGDVGVFVGGGGGRDSLVSGGDWIGRGDSGEKDTWLLVVVVDGDVVFDGTMSMGGEGDL